MSTLKNKNGITLVALIITIIVLLILTMVSIRLVINGGIIDRAERGTKAYSETEVTEQVKLAHSEFEIQKYGANPETNETTFLHSRLDKLYGAENVDITGTDPLIVTIKNNGNTYVIKLASNGSTEQVEWIQDKTIVKNTKTGQILEVGDIVNYDCGQSSYTRQWGILGVENGNLLIMSKESVESISLSGKDGFFNGPTILDNVCIPFKNATYADSARSVKVEDINRVTGYIPGTPLTYTYTMVNGYVKRNDMKNPSSITEFEDIDGKNLQTSTSISVVENNSYYYGISNYIDSNSKAMSLIGYNGSSYWLNNLFAYPDIHYAQWGLKAVLYYDVSSRRLWNSYQGADGYSNGVRTVVVLKQNVKLVGSSSNRMEFGNLKNL